MALTDLLIHLSNFLLPALTLGTLGAAMSKLVWRRELAPVRWWRLAAWGTGGAAVVSVGGLVLFGRDGLMLTYGAMVLAGAAALWCCAFGPFRR